jgi:hypothetical protein
MVAGFTQKHFLVMRGIYDLYTRVGANSDKLRDQNKGWGHGNPLFSADSAGGKNDTRLLVRVLAINLVACVFILGLLWQRIRYDNMLTQQDKPAYYYTSK